MNSANPITIFILTNLTLIAYLTIIVIAGIWMFVKYSKYYLLKEVKLAETLGDRKPRLIGRQLLYTKASSRLVPSSLKSDKDIKAYMVVRDGFPKGRTMKIAIPKGIIVKKNAKTTLLCNAKGIKHDYTRGYYIPFNEYVKANSPSEEVYYEEIDRKLVETDTEVTKAVACSHKSKEWHNMYNSIPIDVEKPKSEEGGIVGIKSSQEDDEAEAKRRAKKNVEKIKSKFSKKDSMEELGGLDL